MQTSNETVYKVADLLLAIEAHLRFLELWEWEMPSDEALQSEEPFSVDTLRFTQWLQFILIPRLKMMIEAHASLPATSDISAYAQEALNGVDFPINELLKLIKYLDDALAIRN
jgi:uncharacterized protein YqcC (DUF446 family)